MPRMNILNAVEQEAFESAPVFNSFQRKQYFDFPQAIQQATANLRTPANQLCFLLSCGYFKASKRFFAAQTFHPRDVEYVVGRTGLRLEQIELHLYAKETSSRHRGFILDFYGFKPFRPHGRPVLAEEIARLLRSQIKPKVIFWRCVDVLIREKIEVPGYFPLADQILSAIKTQNQTLAATIERTLDTATRAVLDDLLTQEPLAGDTVPGKTSAYKLTLMKKLSQSTKPSKVKERVADLDLVRGLYHQLSPALQAIALKPGGIQYYAHSVIRSEIFQLTRRGDPERYLHLLAFIAHQYYRLQDNLVDVLLASLRSFQNGAIREHKELCYARREQRNESLKVLLEGIERGLVSTLTTIGSITEDRALSDVEKVTRIRALLATRETRRLLEKDPIVELKASLASELGEDDYYKILESKSVWIQNRVNPVLKALTFQAGPSVRKLVDAVEHFKEKDGAVDKSAPAGFLDPEEGAAVQKEGKFRVSLYKALLFLHVQSGIKSGALNLEHSYKYRPLDDYLIDRVRWQRDKQHLIERAGLEALVDPRKVLKELDEALSQQYLLTNQNITEGKNPHIKFSKNGGFTLATPKQEESDAEPLQQFFPDRRFVPLVEILATVNRFSHYVDELQHPQQRYHHGKPSEATIYAGMIGIGCTIGLRRMMRISRGVTEAELEHTVNWHFSLDGLQAANDRVLRLMDRLELPNLARRLPDQLHTSSDGQKFEVRVDSLNANYSFKYFGKDQGVAAYTFRDERDLLWYSTVFSSAERESAYVIDGLMHNEVVKSDIHSTDAFGFSELVFAVSHLLGFSYAPRFKNLERQRLYIFRSRKGSDRSAWKIKPAGYADDEIVIQQWDEILRLIATIKLKEVTASDLFRRLNSYSKQHALYQALKAFGQVPKSLFILQVIDDPVLRQAIEKQLDRIEHVHRFTRAVSVGNPREFLQAEKEDQEMAEACKRLIKNCIICWNYLYLSQKLEEIEDAATRQVFLDAVAHGSVISWQHINLLGEYDFSDEKLQDNVGIRPPKLTP
jgi:TnpA family transposase